MRYLFFICRKGTSHLKNNTLQWNWMVDTNTRSPYIYIIQTGYGILQTLLCLRSSKWHSGLNKLGNGFRGRQGNIIVLPVQHWVISLYLRKGFLNYWKHREHGYYVFNTHNTGKIQFRKGKYFLFWGHLIRNIDFSIQQKFVGILKF